MRIETGGMLHWGPDVSAFLSCRFSNLTPPSIEVCTARFPKPHGKHNLACSAELPGAYAKSCHKTGCTMRTTHAPIHGCQDAVIPRAWISERNSKVFQQRALLFARTLALEQQVYELYPSGFPQDISKNIVPMTVTDSSRKWIIRLGLFSPDMSANGLPVWHRPILRLAAHNQRVISMGRGYFDANETNRLKDFCHFR